MAEWHDWIQVYRDYKVLNFVWVETKRKKSVHETKRSCLMRTTRNRLRNHMRTGFEDINSLLNSLLKRDLIVRHEFEGKKQGDRFSYYLLTEKGEAHLRILSQDMPSINVMIWRLKELGTL